jgi:branched-subunit amino acid ABC-type transport system permease component
VVGVVLAVVMEAVLYRPLVARVGASSTLFAVFVASLGIDTALESLINVVWPNAVTVAAGVSPVSVGPVRVTSLMIEAVIVSWVAIVLFSVLLRWTRLGRMIRAVRVNPGLSLDYGISPSVIYLTVFVLGTVLGGIGAVFLAAQSAPTSDMGENIVLYAVTAAFIAGAAGGPVTIGLLALLIGLIQNWSEFFISSAWSSGVVFVILLVYVLGKAGRGARKGRRIMI